MPFNLIFYVSFPSVLHTFISFACILFSHSQDNVMYLKLVLTLLKLLSAGLLVLTELHEVGQDVHRDREHHRAVVLRRDAVQGLEVA